MKKAVVYARSNSKNDDVAEQVKLAKAFADACDYSIELMFADVNASSISYPDTADARNKASKDKNAKKEYRKGLGALFNLIADDSNKIDAIFVDRRTRLFMANKSNSATYIQNYLKQNNVAIMTF